jgi:tRNA(Ile)-lysidine synthetase-like protein
MLESDLNAYHRFVRRTTAALRHRCGVGAGARIIVAVSGGADSVALLHALATIAPKRGWELDVAVGHVQHHLRDEAEQDATFTAELAERLRLPYLRADLDLPAKGNVEAGARKLRYAALADMARAFEAAFVATAHHGDDQLETMLMRLMRGASVKGMGAMAWRRALVHGSAVKLIRPMLATDHDTAVAYLRAIGQSWREDHTNHQRTRLRARLRADVLPPLKAIDADIGHKAVRMADHMRDAARLVDQAIDLAADRVVVTGNQASLDRIEARQLPRAALSGLLRRLLIEAGANRDALGQRVLGPIVRAARDGTGGRRRFDVGQGVCVVVTRQNVVIERTP